MGTSWHESMRGRGVSRVASTSEQESRKGKQRRKRRTGRRDFFSFPFF